MLKVLSKERTLLIPVLLFIVVFTINLKTLCRTIYLGDTPEITAASYILGVAHPTGYPAFLLLGKLLSVIVPFGNIAFRVNLLSAFSMALAAFLIYKVSIHFFPNSLLAAFIALSASFSKTNWAEAGVSKVYMLNIMFLLISIYLFTKFYSSKDIRFLYAVMLSVGIGFANHIFMIIFLIPFLLSLTRKKFRSLLNLKIISKALIFFAIGLSIYLYVPLRAASNPDICWGKPDNISRLSDYLTQQQYNVKKGTRDLSDFAFLLKNWFLLIPGEYGMIFFILSIVGVVLIFFERRDIFYFLTGIIILNLLIVLYYGVGREFHLVYHIPVITLSGFFLVGFMLNERLRSLFYNFKILYVIFPIIILLLFSKNYFESNRSDHLFGYLHGKSLMDTVSKNGTFFGETDTALFPMYYLSFVEGYRKDIKIVDRQMFVVHFLENNFAHINPKEEMKIIRESEADVFYAEYPRINQIRTYEYGLIHKVLKRLPVTSFSSMDFVKFYNPFFENYPELYQDQWTRELVAIYYLLYGNFLGKDKMLEAALSSFKKAGELGKMQIGLLNNLSIYYQSLGAVDEAIITLDKIISQVKKEKTYDYIFKKGEIYYRNGDYDRAKINFMKAKDAPVKNTWTYYYLGNIFLLEAKPEKAIDNFLISLNINPQNYKSLMNLGVTYKSLGKFNYAIENFRAALKYEPGIKEAYYNLAAIYSILNDRANGFYWLKRGLSLFDSALVNNCLTSDEFRFLRSFPEFYDLKFPS